MDHQLLGIPLQVTVVVQAEEELLDQGLLTVYQEDPEVVMVVTDFLWLLQVIL